MHGDFSRWTHRAERRYTAVLKQQGRVELDADANEQAAIVETLRRTLSRDLVGDAGVPLHGGGFTVSIGEVDGAKRLLISPGRLYVNGVLCELLQQWDYAAQPDYPLPEDAPAIPPDGPRRDLVYLDVWQRHVSALEDPVLRDAALGGPDTTTRLQTIFQVKIREDATATCTGLSFDITDATLTNARDETGPPETPCVVSVGGGYTGPENRLYRVEIQQGGTAAEATFKWSRDNGAVVYRVTSYESDNSVKVAQLGRDQVLALRPGDWVELLDDRIELRGEHGPLLKVSQINPTTLTVTFEQSDVPDAAAFDAQQYPKLRRWDGTGDRPQGIPVSDGETLLEDGIRVTLEGTTFHTGDYWFFAARTATREIELLEAAPPHGIQHDYAPLAVIDWAADGSASVCDCRRHFAPLAHTAVLHYVSGDGQEMRPPTSDSMWLCGPLQVRVLNGGAPIANARVRFGIVKPSPAGVARLATLEDPPSNSGTELIVETDEQGLAECRWRLDADTDHLCQRVSAELLDCRDAALPARSLAFNASLRVPAPPAGGGMCTVTLGHDGVNDLQQAVDRLPRSGGCICVPSRTFVQEIPVKIVGRQRITIEGCGPASEVIFAAADRAPLFLVDESREICFERLRLVAKSDASAFFDFARVSDCCVRECRLEGADFGIAAQRSAEGTNLKNLTVADCHFRSQRVAIQIMPESAFVDNLLISGNRIQADRGIRAVFTDVVRAEIVDNQVESRSPAIDVSGIDLLIAGNRVTVIPERELGERDKRSPAVDILMTAGEFPQLRLRENVIFAVQKLPEWGPEAQGIRVRGNSAQIEIAANHCVAIADVLHMYRDRWKDVEEEQLFQRLVEDDRNVVARVIGNTLRAVSVADGVDAVLCGDTPQDLLLQNLLFTDNQILSAGTPDSKRATVSINAFRTIVTDNIIEDQFRDGANSLIVEGIRAQERQILIAHNMSNNNIRDVQGTASPVRDPNLFPFA